MLVDMDHRERVLAALDLKEPDRVPTHAILIDANNVDKMLGKPEMDDVDKMLGKPEMDDLCMFGNNEEPEDVG
jgi:hypothetical protein